MTKPLSSETILSEFGDEAEAWVLQDQVTKKYLTVPDPRYPGRNPIRFFLRREDAEALLHALLEANPKFREKEIFPTRVKLVPALRAIATDRTPGNADSFVVHSPNEVYEYVRDADNDSESR